MKVCTVRVYVLSQWVNFSDGPLFHALPRVIHPYNNIWLLVICYARVNIDYPLKLNVVFRWKSMREQILASFSASHPLMNHGFIIVSVHGLLTD